MWAFFFSIPVVKGSLAERVDICSNGDDDPVDGATNSEIRCCACQSVVHKFKSRCLRFIHPLLRLFLWLICVVVVLSTVQRRTAEGNARVTDEESAYELCACCAELVECNLRRHRGEG